MTVTQTAAHIVPAKKAVGLGVREGEPNTLRAILLSTRQAEAKSFRNGLLTKMIAGATRQLVS